MDTVLIENTIGKTPLVELVKISSNTNGNRIFAKMEGDNPAGSVKDRPALSMIKHAQERGEIQPGDTLIEATSGNTGIALAMAATIRGFKMKLIMPDNMSQERQASMRGYGAEIILVSQKLGMEGARDLAHEMEKNGDGKVLDQFANPDNPLAHYETTGPEIWQATDGKITHFVSAMGTTGTIMGTSRYLKEQSESVQVIGVQPEEGQSIPGIRRWPKAYQKYTIHQGLIKSLMFHRMKQSKPCIEWQKKKVFLLVSLLVVRSRRPFDSARPLKMQISSLSSAIVGIVIFQRVFILKKVELFSRKNQQSYCVE